MARNDNSRRNRSRNWGRNRISNEKNNEKRDSRENREQREDRNSRDRSPLRERSGYRNGQPQRQFANTITRKDIAENEEAIRVFKAQTVVCEICGKPIEDIDTAIANRGSGLPVHFDCVIAKLAESEPVGQNDKITYIGQGKFAVLHFENIHDMRHFTIKKEIEWEARDEARSAWRDEMAGLYSQIK